MLQQLTPTITSSSSNKDKDSNATDASQSGLGAAIRSVCADEEGGSGDLLVVAEGVPGIFLFGPSDHGISSMDDSEEQKPFSYNVYLQKRRIMDDSGKTRMTNAIWSKNSLFVIAATGFNCWNAGVGRSSAVLSQTPITSASSTSASSSSKGSSASNASLTASSVSTSSRGSLFPNALQSSSSSSSSGHSQSSSGHSRLFVFDRIEGSQVEALDVGAAATATTGPISYAYSTASREYFQLCALHSAKQGCCMAGLTVTGNILVWRARPREDWDRYVANFQAVAENVLYEEAEDEFDLPSPALLRTNGQDKTSGTEKKSSLLIRQDPRYAHLKACVPDMQAVQLDLSFVSGEAEQYECMPLIMHLDSLE